MTQDRREFLLQAGLAAAGAAWLNGGPPRRLLVRTAPAPSFRRRLAERELLRGLTRALPGAEARLADNATGTQAGDLVFELRLEAGSHPQAEAYSIAAAGGAVTLSAAGESGLLDAVFDFLERQGAFFGIDGESYPITRAAELRLPAPNQPWTGTPRFAPDSTVELHTRARNCASWRSCHLHRHQEYPTPMGAGPESSGYRVRCLSPPAGGRTRSSQASSTAP